MNEFILGFFIVREGMLSVSSETMNLIIAEKTSIDVVDVGITTSSIGFIVDNFALNGNSSISLHS